MLYSKTSQEKKHNSYEFGLLNNKNTDPVDFCITKEKRNKK